MEFAGITFPEQKSYYWKHENLRDHFWVGGNFSYHLEYSEYYFGLESSIPNEQLFGSDLIRNTNDYPSHLERFNSSQWFEIHEIIVNDHIDFDRPLFNLVYPQRATEYPLREAPTGPIKNGFNYSFETIKYPRETIELYRKTIIYLEALITFALNTLATKRVLLQELHPLEEDQLSLFDDTLYTRNLVQEYIEDLANIKKLIVRLLCWRRVLDLVRYDLLRRLAFIEKLFVEPIDPENIQTGRRYLPVDVCRVINSFVVGVKEVEEGGFSTRLEIFFRSPRNVLFSKWSPEQLEYTQDKLLQKSINSSSVQFDFAGVWYDPIDSCLREISDNLSALSFDTNYELDYPEDTKKRSPWADISRAHGQVKYWVAETSTVVVYKYTSWLGVNLLTARRDRAILNAEEPTEEDYEGDYMEYDEEENL
jgi:hypothetical protein